MDNASSGGKPSGNRHVNVLRLAGFFGLGEFSMATNTTDEVLDAQTGPTETTDEVMPSATRPAETSDEVVVAEPPATETTDEVVTSDPGPTETSGEIETTERRSTDKMMRKLKRDLSVMKLQKMIRDRRIRVRKSSKPKGDPT